MLCVSVASARLYNTDFAERSELIQVIGYSRENHLDMDSANCGYEHMSRLENRLDHRERPLARRSYSANLKVSPSVPGTQRVTSRRPMHGYRSASSRCTKIAFVLVDGFTLYGQIYLAVVNRRGGRLYGTNQTILRIYIIM